MTSIFDKAPTKNHGGRNNCSHGANGKESTKNARNPKKRLRRAPRTDGQNDASNHEDAPKEKSS